MKFMHLADLHLGKSVNKFSMLEDQKYIISQILKIAEEEKPDGILIAGDVYDTGIPPLGAVELFDDFLTQLSAKKIPVFIIAGNHDSAERMSFGSKLMENSGIYFASAFNGQVVPVTLQDENGPVNIYMLPFIKPVHVRSFFESDAENIQSYTDACAVAIRHMNVNPKERNILITHQFVTGASISGSEDILQSVGGSENVDGAVFNDFDYVALGHLHGSQKVGRETIRYSGTPLKYSFSEVNHKKSVTIFELGKKDADSNGKAEVSIYTKDLVPLRDWKILKGEYNQLMSKKFYESLNLDDFYNIILTDEIDVPEAFGRLGTVYKNIMTMSYENSRTAGQVADFELMGTVEKIDPIEAFKTFFKQQNNKEMTSEQITILQKIKDSVFGEEK